jgi:hypothetical protein
MPWQLIYTSAPRGLLSGQSGFCTVARSPDLREALVQRLEQISSYHYLRVSEAATAHRNPTISAYRLLDLRGTKYYVLTRIQPCGLDFTARTNHLAHHLIFEGDELAKLPSPAALLRQWPGWLPSWQGEPRWLESLDASSFASLSKYFLPAQTWARMTGDGGRAAGLLESECVRGCYLACPPGSEEQMLEMYCETLQLLNFNGQFPLRPWRHTFTSFLQAEDNPNDFHWRGCQENTPAYQQAINRSAPLIPLRSVRIPSNSLVKLAREEPKPPPTPTPPPPSPSSASRDESTNTLSLRKTSVPPPVRNKTEMQTRPPLPTKPDGRIINISIQSATLASLGIFAAVLVVLLLLKRSAHRPAEQGSLTLNSTLESSSVIAPPSMAVSTNIISAPALPASDVNRLNCLTGEGRTYVLAVPNLTNFSLPINSVLPLGNLLRRYDKLEQGALPADIQLTAGVDRWDFQPGARLQVNGRKDRQFSASGSGFDCVLDYADWLVGKDSSLTVETRFDTAPGSFSLHFSFTSTNDGDPFRLLIVNEHNPPSPLSFPMQFVQKDRQGFEDSLEVSLRRSLLANFQLLGGRQWQLRPYARRNHSAEYLYADWPAEDRPNFGRELDFAHIGQHLEAQRQTLQKRLDDLRQPLRRPLGKFLGATNDNLKSFLTFSPTHPTPAGFLEYLGELKKAAPEKSWIKQWHDRPDSDQPQEVAGNLHELYQLWTEKQPQDQPVLTVTNKTGITNYFFESWRHLNENLKEWESAQSQMEGVQNRLVELGEVAYIGLFIVDPNQPRQGLEMIRFEGGKRIY